MKFAKFFALAAAVLALAACDDPQKDDEKWTEVAMKTIRAYAGDYIMVSAQFSMPIALAPDAAPGTDVIRQAEQFGWLGFQSSNDRRAWDANRIEDPSAPTRYMRVDLAVPFPDGAPGKSVYPGHCCIEASTYHVVFQVGPDGSISPDHLLRSFTQGTGGKLENIDVRIQSDRIYFEADGKYYDWSTSSWKEG